MFEDSTTSYTPIRRYIGDINDIKDCDVGEIKKGLKDNKAKFVCAVQRREDTANKPAYLIFGQNNDGVSYWSYNDASGLFWKHGPFTDKDKALSRASCMGMFESKTEDSENHLFEDIYTKSR